MPSKQLTLQQIEDAARNMTPEQYLLWTQKIIDESDEEEVEDVPKTATD